MHNRSVPSLVQCIKDNHVLITNLELEDVGIILDPVWIVAFGQWNPFLLQRVSQQYLSRSFRVLIRDSKESRVVSHVISDQGRVCLDNDPKIFAICIDLLLLAPRVELQIG